MRTVFIKPNAKKKQYGQVINLSAIEPPVWLALYAKSFPDAFVIDMEAENLDNDDAASRIKALGAERVIVFATGSHPSAHVQQTEAAQNLQARLAAEMKVTVEIFNHLPFNPIASGGLDWKSLPVDKYRAHNWHAWGRPDKSYGATFASISCPFHCDFCCIKDFYRSEYRQRDPGLVVQDIKGLVERGVTNIKMMDELFVVNNAGVNRVLDMLASDGLGERINIWAYARIDTVTPELMTKLIRAGVRWLAYGIESGNEEIRKGAMKGRFTNEKIRDIVRMTQGAGIHVVGNYMFGFWDDTMATMQETLDFAKELNCEYSNFYCVTIYPGSKLYDEMAGRGVDLPRTSEEFSQMSPRFKPVPTRHVTGAQVLGLRDRAFMEYHSGEKYLSMMGKAFGPQVVAEIKDMLKIKIRETV